MKSGDQVEAHLRNLDRRVDRVEQILPTLATKVDLKAFATKEDLKAFATKEDLKAFATKEDLKAFPTRDEMREAIQEAVGQVRVLFEAQTHEIRLMAETLNAHLHRHETLERRVDGQDASLDAPDLRVRRLESPRRRRTT
jgi:hypothetical protein